MSNKPKFKIGDKVRVLPNGPQLKDYHGIWIREMNTDIGKEYTIKKIYNPDITKKNIGPFYGYGLDGTYWAFDERNLEFVKSSVASEKQVTEKQANIIFKFKKNKIIAKREGGLKATASCHPDDTYDITIGMKLAFIRLLKKEKEVKEREATPIEGFYICTKSDSQFSSGNIYRFKDGFVRCDYGILYGPYKEVQKRNKTVYIDKAVFEEIKWEYA